MKQVCSLLMTLIGIILLTACGPSDEAVVQTAIAETEEAKRTETAKTQIAIEQTQAAKPTETPIPTATPTPIPTATPTPIPTATPTVSPFIGFWVSTDPGDGSNQQLSISESDGEHKVAYIDEVASSCGLDGAGKAIGATGTGLGTVKGNVLGVDYSIYCMTDPQSFLASTHVDYAYNETTDTIEDAGTIWSRP